VPDHREVLCRVPPHAEDAEKAGAILVDSGALQLVLAVLGAGDFYVEAHRAIFEAMVDLSSRGVTIDAVTLAEALRQRGQFERVGGAAYLDQLIDVVPVVAHVEEHAAIIRDRALARAAILAASQIVAEAFEGADPTALSTRFSEAAAAILPACREERPGEIRIPMEGRGEDGKTPVDLGAWIGSLAPAQKVVVGGRTSEGKTALKRGMWLACGLAGIPAVYLTLEDSLREIACGAAAAASWLSTRAMLARHWSDDARAEAARIAAWLDRMPLHVQRLVCPTCDELAHAIRWQVARNHVRVVFVDYLQAIGGDERRGENRAAYLGRALSAMTRAVGEEAILVVGSQLRRAPAGFAKDRPPTLDEARDSGRIEEDAKIVMLLRRVGERCDGDGKAVTRQVEIDVAKNKLGPTGKLPATLWLRHSLLWPGCRRPQWNLDEGPAAPVERCSEEDDQPPEWLQQELPPGVPAHHDGFEDDPWGG
jgi:replicative DNA helicase